MNYPTARIAAALRLSVMAVSLEWSTTGWRSGSTVPVRNGLHESWRHRSAPAIVTADMDGGSRRGDGPQLNVYGEPLADCSRAPLTGWTRNGCCETDASDVGVHTVCAVMTADFLEFSRSRGNDLSTPRTEFGFPGLQPGDRWCLCAARWLEAHRAGRAPRVALKATHRRTLAIVDLETLKPYAIDLT